MATDKVLLEVLNNRFTGIVEEMGYIIHRASFTVFVKETWDFDSALVTTDGEIFCYPRNIGVTNMLGMHMGDALRCIADYEPGVVVLANCRIPDQNWGDMKALLAALSTCERRMDDVVARYGEGATRAVISELLHY